MDAPRVHALASQGRIVIAMTINHRETFRIHPEDFDARLQWQGRAFACTIENVSAGGAKVTTDATPPTDAPVSLIVRARSQPAGAAAVETTFPMIVLETGAGWLRLRSSVEDSLSHLVFEAQRIARARETGADESSPMASDEQRRSELRTEQRPRFSRGSTRPGFED